MKKYQIGLYRNLYIFSLNEIEEYEYYKKKFKGYYQEIIIDNGYAIEIDKSEYCYGNKVNEYWLKMNNFPKYIKTYDGFIGVLKRLEYNEYPVYSFDGCEGLADNYEVEHGSNNLKDLLK